MQGHRDECAGAHAPVEMYTMWIGRSSVTPAAMLMSSTSSAHAPFSCVSALLLASDSAPCARAPQSVALTSDYKPPVSCARQ